MDTMSRADLSTQASNILTSARNTKKGGDQDQEQGIKTENGLILGNMDRYQSDPYYYLQSEKDLSENDRNFIIG